ncbi:MAG: cobalt-zinc-cadmium efflux system protein [Actinomycetota bacterium]|jgi:cobalt-zinc-cadmium efflux system protein|nr:cobalt-zinc-cadmium efflux system protein [Actinomycetota bacterium]
MGRDHSHVGTAAASQRGRLTVVLSIAVTILVAEVAGGLISGSLVLLADAGHLAADAAGIGLSLLALTWAARPATSKRSFGYQRAEILAAVVNAVVLFGLGAFLIVQAIRRLAHPGDPDPGVMAVFGAAAVVGNGVSLLLLRRGQAQSLNVRGAYLEVLSDLLGAVAVLVAALVIAVTGFARIDALASLAISLLIVPRTMRLLKDAVDVLLEATPKGVDLDDVRQHILDTEGVVGCHDLHAWTITSGVPVLSAHVVIEDRLWTDGTAPQVLDRLAACLHGHFDLEHSTFQLEQDTHVDHENVLHA